MGIQLVIGPENFANYRRLNYQWWYAVAEFVDNATQSYFDNRSELDAQFSIDDEEFSVSISTGEDLIRIRDNAMGMSRDDLARAMIVGRPPKNFNGRCRYGLGMKTAACWIGDKWTITTKRYGETEELTVVVDVPKIADGNSDLPLTSKEASAEDHYTIIEIKSHHRPLRGSRTIGKIKEYLKSIYRVDLASNEMFLYYNSERLTWDKFSTDEFMARSDQTRYWREFDFVIGEDGEEKKVSGWIGILERGSRKDGGISILHRNRVIKGWPEAWRPYAIYGDARNDLINQRIAGEVHLEDFEVSHTKDDINWYGAEEEEVGKGLQKAAADFMAIARQPKKGAIEGPSDVVVDTAIKELKEEITSPEFIKQLELEDSIPEGDTLAQMNENVVSRASAYQPVLDVKVGNMRVTVYLYQEASPYDPYFIAESKAPNEVIAVVNPVHPHFGQLSGENSVLNYLRHCVYDAIAEHKTNLLTGKINPDTVKMFKDSFLRVGFEVIQEK